MAIRNLQKFSLSAFTGKNTSQNPAASIPGTLASARNVIILNDGMVRRAQGYTKVTTIGSSAVLAIGDFERNVDGKHFVFVQTADGNITAMQTDGSAQQTISTGESTDPFQFVQNSFICYASNGKNAWRFVDKSGTLTKYKWGMDAATSAALISLSAGSLTLTWGRRYVYCPVSKYTDSLGIERVSVGPPSPFSTHSGPISSQTVNLSGIEVFSDPQVNFIWIFATSDSPIDTSSTFYFAAEIANGTTSWADTLPDESLDQTKLAPFDNNPAPPSPILTTFQNRVAAANGNQIRLSGYSEITLGIPEEAWPLDLFFNVPSGSREITAMITPDQGTSLVVDTAEAKYRYTGYDATTFTEQDRIASPGAIGSLAQCLTPFGVAFLSQSKRLWLWSSTSGNPPTEISADVAQSYPGTYGMEDLSDAHLADTRLAWYSYGKVHFLALFAQTNDAPALTSGPTYNNATGQAFFFASRPLEHIRRQVVIWSNFAVAGSALPSDAVITGIFPVIVASGVQDQAFSYYLYGTGLGMFDDLGSPFTIPSNPNGTTFSSQLFYDLGGPPTYPNGIGTSLSALTGYDIKLDLSQTLWLDNYYDHANVTAVGFAVYYTSATPVVDPQIPAPFPVPAGSGVSWALPATVNAVSAPTDGLIKITQSQRTSGIATFTYTPVSGFHSPSVGQYISVVGTTNGGLGTLYALDAIITAVGTNTFSIALAGGDLPAQAEAPNAYATTDATGTGATAGYSFGSAATPSGLIPSRVPNLNLVQLWSIPVKGSASSGMLSGSSSFFNQIGGIYESDKIPANSFSCCQVVHVGNEPFIYVGDANGNIYRFPDTYTDNGNIYVSNVSTPWSELGYEGKKRMYWVDLYVQPQGEQSLLAEVPVDQYKVYAAVSESAEDTPNWIPVDVFRIPSPNGQSEFALRANLQIDGLNVGRYIRLAVQLPQSQNEEILQKAIVWFTPMYEGLP